MRAKDYRHMAWSALKGRYWWSLLGALIAWVFGGLALNFGFKNPDGSEIPTSGLFSATGVLQHLMEGLGEITARLSAQLTSVFAARSAVVMLVSLVIFIIGFAVSLGYRVFNIALYQSREKPEMDLMFSRTGYIGKAFSLNFRLFFRIAFGFVLFIIPGIVAIYKYNLADFILAENPELSAREAILRSREIMKGHKWKKFCLDLSFIGWDILAGIVPCGLVFLTPYKQAADAAFYLNRCGRLTR